MLCMADLEEVFSAIGRGLHRVPRRRTVVRERRPILYCSRQGRAAKFAKSAQKDKPQRHRDTENAQRSRSFRFFSLCILCVSVPLWFVFSQVVIGESAAQPAPVAFWLNRALSARFSEKNE